MPRGRLSPSKPSLTPVDALKHRDKRVNIPTEELRDFIADDEQRPATVLYPRDPSLDPQLVWKGKDEQDAAPLEVPAVPVYIQEKIHPQAIIENVRAEARRPPSGSPLEGGGLTPSPSRGRGGEGDFQLALFSDFNGLPFEDMVDFYRHDLHWSNRMILGDSLLVMTSLAEKEGLKGQVQMIYLDPPYGIKFGSNWQVSTRKRDVKDGKAEDATRQPEQVRAFRDTWQLGIHSYLAYLRDRLVVARELLTESGSLFVQIGDENVHLVRCLLDEVFGAENQCGTIAFVKTTSQTAELLASVSDYVLWYAKDRSQIKYRQLFVDRNRTDAIQKTYQKAEDHTGTIRNLRAEEIENASLIPADHRVLSYGDMVSQSGSDTTRQPFQFSGRWFVPRAGGWKTNSVGLARLARAGHMGHSGATLLFKRYIDDFPFRELYN